MTLVIVCFFCLNNYVLGQPNYSYDRIIQHSYNVTRLCSNLLNSIQDHGRFIYTKDTDMEIVFLESYNENESSFILKDFVPYYKKNVDLVCQTNGIVFQNLNLGRSDKKGLNQEENLIRIPELTVNIKDSTLNNSSSRVKWSTSSNYPFLYLIKGKIAINGFQMIDPDFNKIAFLKGVLRVVYSDKRIEIKFSEGFLIELNGQRYQFENDTWIGTNDTISRPPNEDNTRAVFREIFSPDGVEDDKKINIDVGTGMFYFIHENIVVPKKARKRGFDKFVVIGFEIDVNGRIKNAKIVRDPGYDCGQEVLRVVKLMDGMFIPARNRNGLPVHQLFNYPVRIKVVRR